MILKLDSHFIIGHMEELIQLEDYVPVIFIEFDKQNERDDFLKSKNLLHDIQAMNQLIRQKCEHYEDTEKAVNSVLIEWLDLHPEFEGIIASESVRDYQNMKQNNEFMSFIDLLYDVELPSEKKEWSPSKEGLRDDSTIQLPNFKEMDKIHDTFEFTLLADYLSYIV